MEGYRPGEECAKCRGRCCREKGCSLSPEDLLRELKRRKEGFEKEDLQGRDFYEQLLLLLQETDRQPLYAIDSFETAKGAFFYLRMRHKCYTFVGIDAIGECTALTPEGCTLLEKQRPKGGRFLESAPDGGCRQHYTREMMYADWEPYQEVLGRIYREYEKRFREDGTFDACDEAYFRFMREQREGKKITEE